MTIEEKIAKIEESVLRHGFQALFIKDWDGRQGKRWELSSCGANCAISPACMNCPSWLLRKKMGGGPAKFLGENILRPLDWAKRHMVFVCPQGDLFHSDISTNNIAKVFAVMHRRRDHCYIVLTKRAGRMSSLLSSPQFFEEVMSEGHELFDDFEMDINEWGRNLLVGVSVEDQVRMERAEELPYLPKTMGKVLFTAPLLEGLIIPASVLRRLNWVVCNRERGSTYCSPRPCDVEWIKSLKWQCEGASVPFFLEDRHTPELIGELGGIPREYPAILAR